MATTKKDGTPRQKPVSRVIHIFEVLDDNGNPVKVNKANINTIVATRDTGKALDMMENGDHPHAVFVRAELA